MNLKLKPAEAPLPAQELKRSTSLNSEVRAKLRFPTANKSTRIAALDFTKGSLVLVMVLYHWLNYFIGSQGSYYKYLRFLPPSFIFITGFLISHLYLSNYRTIDARLAGRLLVRGIKLLAIFVALNAIISLLIPGAYRGGSSFLDTFSARDLTATYLTGNFVNGRPAAFYVLLPISYLLVLCSGLLPLIKFYKAIVHIFCGGLFLSILFLASKRLTSANLELLTIGFLGVSVGYIPISKINRVVDYRYALIFAYLCYLAAINVWNVSFELQVTGVCLTLMLIYLLGEMSGESGAVQKVVILLGKYSLFGYIAQIAILQFMRRSFVHTNLGPWGLGASFLAALALTILAVEAIDRMRSRVLIVNRLYVAVFS